MPFVLLPFLVLRENRNRQAWTLVILPVLITAAASAAAGAPIVSSVLGPVLSGVAACAVGLSVLALAAQRIARGRAAFRPWAAWLVLVAASAVAWAIEGEGGGAFIAGLIVQTVTASATAAGVTLAGWRCRLKGTSRAFLGWTVLFAGIAQIVLGFAAVLVSGIVWAALCRQGWMIVGVLAGGGVASAASGLALAAIIACAWLPIVRLPALRSRLDAALGC